MSVKTNHDTKYGLWFITFTCFNWKPLFQLTQSYNLVYNWFNYLHNTKTADVCAYVIIPNHIHVILNIPTDTKPVNTIVANAKRFMAYALIEQIKQQGNITLLNELAIVVTDRERKKGQLHKVFEESFDAKPIYTFDFLSRRQITYTITR
jgi:REP element-mobilizing transposase RayT